jgi:hypothetical protein
VVPTPRSSAVHRAGGRRHLRVRVGHAAFGPEHDEGERKQAIKAAYDLSVAQAAAAAEAVAAAEAAAAAAAEAVAAQVYNGPPSAGSSPDQGIAIDDEDDEEDAEFEVEDEYEQGPPAKRRRM